MLAKGVGRGVSIRTGGLAQHTVELANYIAKNFFDFLRVAIRPRSDDCDWATADSNIREPANDVHAGDPRLLYAVDEAVNEHRAEHERLRVASLLW